MMKVLVVDGSKQQRKEIVEALARIDDIAVQGAVADVRSALPVLAGDTPDFVVVGGAELRDVVSELADEPDPAAAPELALLGRLAGGVIHDLNNYLTMIAGCARLAERDPDDPAGFAQLRATVLQAGRLTAGLLAYVRGEQPPIELLDLGSLVRSTLDLARSSIADTIELVDEVDPELGPIRGIRAELEQLVLNLVLNAADAMPGGGELRVRVRGSEARIILEISDTGDGITIPGGGAGGLTASTKPGRRAGLGLGIVRRVAARHGASVRFAHGLPSGTVVTVVFSSHH